MRTTAGGGRTAKLVRGQSGCDAKSDDGFLLQAALANKETGATNARGGDARCSRALSARAIGATQNMRHRTTRLAAKPTHNVRHEPQFPAGEACWKLSAR
jgi:hypothetical protein